MLPTYPAFLHENRIEWAGDAPSLGPDRPVRVHVTLLDPVPPPTPDQGGRMAAALEKLAAGGEVGPSFVYERMG